jgi:hypothetical protein
MIRFSPLGRSCSGRYEIGVALEVRHGEQLAARDPDRELPLQPEEDVEEVDRLRPQVALQRACRLHVLFLDVQRLDQGRGHLAVDLVWGWHGRVLF